MKRIFTLIFTAFAVFSLAACGGKKDTGETQIKVTPAEKLIVGTWATEAPYKLIEGPMTIIFDNINVVYNKNHTARFTGSMTMNGDMLPNPIKMNVETQSTWSIAGNILTETITDAKIDMTQSIAGVPDMGPVIADQMKSQGAKPSTIVKLDETTLNLKNEQAGIEVVYTRQ